MFNNKKETSANIGAAASIDTLIGNGCTLTGDVVTQKSLKIDGVVNGNVTAEGSIVVAERGSIKGEVKCKELVVYGVIEGNIHAENLHLHTTSRIIGEINTQKLQVESGAIYQGSVNMNVANDKNASKPKAPKKDEKAISID